MARYGLRVASHGVLVVLAPHVRGVCAGTPLRPTARGWDIDADAPEAFAGTGAGGGERLTVFRTVTLHNEAGEWDTGRRYKIADVQWTGYPVFELDDEGPYRAWGPELMTLDAAVAGAVARLLPLGAGSVSPPPAPAAVEPPPTAALVGARAAHWDEVNNDGEV